jgi:triacylglycerol lipase
MTDRRTKSWLLPRTVLPPIWRELGPRLSPGPRLPPAPVTGAGGPVLLIPGYFSGDGSLRGLAVYLTRAGHLPVTSGIACNVGCSEVMVGRLVDRVQSLADAHGTRVAVVGHSRGGLLGRAVAMRRPDLVSGVVSLASPLLDHLAVHPLLWAHALGVAVLGTLGVPGFLKLSCGAGECCTQFWRDLQSIALPSSVGSLAVYTRTDGVVDWRACVDPHGPALEAVGTTHSGIVSHAPTLHAVALALGAFKAADDLRAELTAPPMMRDTALSAA